jgi:hypothetical protein
MTGKNIAGICEPGYVTNSYGLCTPLCSAFTGLTPHACALDPEVNVSDWGCNNGYCCSGGANSNLQRSTTNPISCVPHHEHLIVEQVQEVIQIIQQIILTIGFQLLKDKMVKFVVTQKMK